MKVNFMDIVGQKKNQKQSGTYTQTSGTFVYLISSHIGIAKGHVQDWVATSQLLPVYLNNFPSMLYLKINKWDGGESGRNEKFSYLSHLI